MHTSPATPKGDFFDFLSKYITIFKSTGLSPRTFILSFTSPGQKGFLMSKIKILTLGIIATSACAVAGLITIKQTTKRKELIDELLNLRDDLEFHCDRINSYVCEMPEMTTTPTDKKYVQTIEKSIVFTNAVFPLHQALPDAIDKLSTENLEAYIESFKTTISRAEDIITALSVAHEEMIASHAADTSPKSDQLYQSV